MMSGCSFRFAFLTALVSSVAAIHVPAQFQSTPAIDDNYRQAFEKWKAELVDDRKQNWLTLVGLFWLKPGENSFGADASNALVLPGTIPSHAGTFRLQGKDVTMSLSQGVGATIQGKAVTSAKLDPDTSSHPTVVELGSMRMLAIQRGERIGIRVKDFEAPAARTYRGPTFYPLSVLYLVVADWMPSDGKRTVQVPNVLGDITATPVVGEARFALAGQVVRLTAVGGDATHGLFIIFSDPTRKTDTYPAGRFLDTDAVTDGKVLLDFNRAYNPPCSLTPYATCPLPPSENQLSIAIPAGEKYDRAQGHH
jgi:uncharacterized protein (DUF1684 family)